MAKEASSGGGDELIGSVRGLRSRRGVRLFLHADGRDVSSQLADNLIHLPNGLPTLAEVRRFDYLFSEPPGK